MNEQGFLIVHSSVHDLTLIQVPWKISASMFSFHIHSQINLVPLVINGPMAEIIDRINRIFPKFSSRFQSIYSLCLSLCKLSQIHYSSFKIKLLLLWLPWGTNIPKLPSYSLDPSCFPVTYHVLGVSCFLKD